MSKMPLAVALFSCALFAQGAISIKVEGGDFPEKKEWAEKELVPALEAWAPNIVRLMDGENAVKDWGEITLELSRKPNVAHSIAGQNLFRLNMDWAAKDPDEVTGACIHELGHLVADYRPAEGRAEPWTRCPKWLSEGIMDWVRWCNFEGEAGVADGNENGLVGQYCHGNEPCHHVIYYFTLMGRRDLAAKYIKEVADTLYSADFFGLCGNENCGQMCAWYVFSAFGFFPFDSCGTNYVLGQPFPPEVKLRVGSCEFRVVNNGGGNGEVKLNGRTLECTYVNHADVTKGATLEF